MTKNIRFFDYINGSPVKITLKPGQRVEHYSSRRTEEGYERLEQSWRYDGSSVQKSYDREGSDCDGRSSYSSEYFATERYSDRGLHLMDWQEGRYSKRDYSAEAMGY